MRITSDGANNIPSVYSVPFASPVSGMQNSEKTQEAKSSFDQVHISQSLSGGTQFQKELAARLVRDVRASNSTGAVQQVRDRVQAGTYRLNPDRIASAIMLED